MNVLLLEQSHIIGKRILNIPATEEKLKVTWVPVKGDEDFSLIDKYYTNIFVILQTSHVKPDLGGGAAAYRARVPLRHRLRYVGEIDRKYVTIEARG